MLAPSSRLYEHSSSDRYGLLKQMIGPFSTRILEYRRFKVRGDIALSLMLDKLYERTSCTCASEQLTDGRKELVEMHGHVISHDHSTQPSSPQ